MSGASEAATAVMTSTEPFSVSSYSPIPPPSQNPAPPAEQQMLMPYGSSSSTYRPVESSPPPLYQSIPEGAVVIRHVNSGEQKRRRGRPRKYGPDGNMGSAQKQSFSPPPQPTASQFPVSGSAAVSPTVKKSRGRPLGSSNKRQKVEPLGSTGIGFIPHVLDVAAGEDVALKIMAFSQNGPRAVVVLSGSGAIANVTLRQAATSGGTATYEGRFDIVSLSGSFMLMEVEGQKSRTGGLSIMLSGPDGRVLGGCVAGVLVAATPVQVIVGSFMADAARREPKQGNHVESSSGPLRLNMGGAAGPSSSPSRGTMSESSGGPASPLNLSSGACNNIPQGMSGMPWKC
ncbi:hypothetical protein ACJIZ3_003315 [Penstemon smallii]|uniref:AT-hook motif nuclear-localized protein n=1 Tax=Penstemon smallii TaxID=265156 RepID=A0ABD3U8W6_9LAMI